MNISIKATKTTLTAPIKAFVEEKLDVLSAFLKPEDKIRVELEIDKKHHSGLVFRAEVDIQPHGHYAEARGNNFYESFDLVIPKIKEQLAKKKDRLISKRRQAARKCKR